MTVRFPLAPLLASRERRERAARLRLAKAARAALAAAQEAAAAETRRAAAERGADVTSPLLMAALATRGRYRDRVRHEAACIASNARAAEEARAAAAAEHATARLAREAVTRAEERWRAGRRRAFEAACENEQDEVGPGRPLASAAARLPRRRF